MAGGSWIRSRLLRWARSAYNGGKYQAALRRSRFSSIFFRDASFLDLTARSALMLNRFDVAAHAYRRASDSGWVLKNHRENHFKAELNAGNLLESLLLISSDNSETAIGQRKLVVKHLSELTETERVEIIAKISETQNLHEDLAELLPWKPQKIELAPQPQSFFVLKNETYEIGRYKRELSRIRNSTPHRLMNLFSSSIKSPMRTILLPFTFTGLLLRIAREKLGLVGKIRVESFPISNRTAQNRDSVVLFPTNGVGFGHFTRLLAVAKKIREKSPETEIVFFTTMPTLHVLAEYDFPSYHISGRYRFNEMPPNIWNSICEEMLNLVFSLHRPSAFIFDGSFPYRGMLNALMGQDDSMLKVWLRRGSIRPGARNIPVDSINHFHAIVRPGDSVGLVSEDELDHGVSLVQTNPITLIDSKEMVEFGTLRKRLGIPSNSLLCYIQLGAGKINNISSEMKMVLESLQKHPQVYAVIGESMLGSRIPSKFERVRILRDFPNSRYFTDFDFAVMAGGYNSFHEAIEAKLPTICFPNLQTGRDDQLARALVAEEAGCMVVISERKRNIVQAAIDRMVETEVRGIMRNNFKLLHRENGADQIASWLLSQKNSN